MRNCEFINTRLQSACKYYNKQKNSYPIYASQVTTFIYDFTELGSSKDVSTNKMENVCMFELLSKDVCYIFSLPFLRTVFLFFISNFMIYCDTIFLE
jgi:hypothetical protein